MKGRSSPTSASSGRAWNEPAVVDPVVLADDPAAVTGMDAWIQRHRKRYAGTRKEFWADPTLGWTTKPFPEKGQFK